MCDGDSVRQLPSSESADSIVSKFSPTGLCNGMRTPTNNPFDRSRPSSGGSARYNRPPPDLKLVTNRSSSSSIPESGSTDFGPRLPSLEGLNISTQIDRNQKITPLTGDGELRVSNDEVVKFAASDLVEECVLNHGSQGWVYRMRFERATRKDLMAVKRLRVTWDDTDRKQLLKEIDVLKLGQGHRNIIKLYGTLLHEGELWICMQLMDASLNDLYKFVYGEQNSTIPEDVLGHITISTVSALVFLKSKHKVIHRDVKPSNILVNSNAEPERIQLDQNDKRYDVRTDVWSLGITLYECATGSFPYDKSGWNSHFKQLDDIVQGDAPRLHDSRLSPECCEFINMCLTKERKDRPKYDVLTTLAFFRTNKSLRDDNSYRKRVLTFFRDTVGAFVKHREANPKDDVC